MNIKTGSDEKLARMRNDEIEKWKFKTLNVIWNMNCKKFLKVEQQAVDTAPLPKDRIKVLKLLTVYSQGKQAVTR